MQTVYSRRQTLQMLASSTVFGGFALSSGLTLIGCGGAGGGGREGGIDEKWPVGPITGRVDATGMLTGAVSIGTLFGTFPLGADGAFKAEGYVGSFGAATVQDAAGRVLGLAFIKAGDAAVDSRRVAQSLAYLALDGHFFDPKVREPFFRALGDNPVVGVIANDLNAISGPMEGNPAVTAALTSALAPLLPTRSRPGPTRGLLVDPANERSGLQVNQQGLDEVVLRNGWRRRTYAFIDRIESTDENGVATPRNDRIKDFPFGQVDSPTSINGLVADIGWLLGSESAGATAVGDIAWVPNEAGPFSLPVFPNDASRTKYRVTIVGPGQLGSPPAGLPADVEQKRRAVVVQAWSLDVILPTMIALVGPLIESAGVASIKGGGFEGASPRTREFFEMFSKAIIDLMSALLSEPDIQSKCDLGDYDGAWHDVFNAIVTSEAWNRLFNQLVDFVIRTVVDYLDETTLDRAKLLLDLKGGQLRLDKIASIWKVADAILQGADFIVLFSAWNAASAYETFTVDVTRTKVRLLPPVGSFPAQGELSLTATVPDASGGSDLVTYKWSVVGPAGVVLHSPTTEGTAISTSTGAVLLVSRSGAGGSATVTVEAIRNGNGSNDVSLGTTKGTYKVVSTSVKISPTTTRVNNGKTVNLSAKITNPEPHASYLLKWSVDHGTLDVVPDLTIRQAIKYTAPTAPTEAKVTVRLFQQTIAELVELGSDVATVTVGDDEPVVESGSFRIVEGVSKNEPTRGFNYAAVTFAEVPGAIRYRVVGTGSYDPVYYGDRIEVSYNPNNPYVDPNGETHPWLVNLGGGAAPLENVAAGSAEMQRRLGGFTYTVTAYFK